MPMMLSRWPSCKLTPPLAAFDCVLTMLQGSDPDTVFAGMSMSDEVHKELIAIIKRRMTPHPVKIRARKCICWMKRERY